MRIRLRPSTWVVVPAHNESTYISRVLKKITRHTHRIVVVDDGSRDNTAALARAHTPYVLSHQINLGKGAALKTGCEFVRKQPGAKAIIFIDADDQHDVSLLPKFEHILETEKVDIVFGVRHFAHMPWFRRLGNVSASALTWLFFQTYIPDIPSGYKALSVSTYQKIQWTSQAYGIEMEIAALTARYRLRWSKVGIPTIYWDLTRGMTVLDILTLFFSMVEWKIRP